MANISKNLPSPSHLAGRAPTKEELAFYSINIQPKLFDVSTMINGGASESEVFSFLGISRVDFYKFKELFPDFRNAVNIGKASFVKRAESALFEAATGKFVEERETIESYGVDDEGNMSLRGKKVRKLNKYIPPNVKALEIYLTNRASDNWKKAVEATQGTTNILQISASKEDIDTVLKQIGDPLSALKLVDGYND